MATREFFGCKIAQRGEGNSHKNTFLLRIPYCVFRISYFVSSNGFWAWVADRRLTKSVRTRKILLLTDSVAYKKWPKPCYVTGKPAC